MAIVLGHGKAARHDAVHVRDLGMQAASDETVLEQARAGEQILRSADTDCAAEYEHGKYRDCAGVLLRRFAWFWLDTVYGAQTAACRQCGHAT